VVQTNVVLIIDKLLSIRNKQLIAPILFMAPFDLTSRDSLQGSEREREWERERERENTFHFSEVERERERNVNFFREREFFAFLKLLKFEEMSLFFSMIFHNFCRFSSNRKI
jgi:hypothetical protein